MCSRILITNCAIGCGGEYGAVAHDHGSDWNLVSLYRLAREVERVPYVLLVDREG